MSFFECAFQMRCVRSNGYEGNMNVALCAKFLQEVGLLTALFKMNVSTAVKYSAGTRIENSITTSRALVHLPEVSLHSRLLPAPCFCFAVHR